MARFIECYGVYIDFYVNIILLWALRAAAVGGAGSTFMVCCYYSIGIRPFHSFATCIIFAFILLRDVLMRDLNTHNVL